MYMSIYTYIHARYSIFSKSEMNIYIYIYTYIYVYVDIYIYTCSILNFSYARKMAIETDAKVYLSKHEKVFPCSGVRCLCGMWVMYAVEKAF